MSIDPKDLPPQKPPEVTEAEFDRALAESPDEVTTHSDSDDGLIYDPPVVRTVDPETE